MTNTICGYFLITMGLLLMFKGRVFSGIALLILSVPLLR